MEYSNPKIPEGINTSKEHPLKEFATLTVGILAVIIVVAAILALSADWLAGRIPFRYEVGLASGFEMAQPSESETQKQLQALADRLANTMQLPDDMSIIVHYADEDMVNAAATLGGHVIMFRGLLEKLDSENALAMVMAHEIAHIKLRHPIRALGRGIVVSLAITAAAGASGDYLAGKLIGDAGTVTLLSFSREQEQAADRAGMAAVETLYGHVNGTLDLYRILIEETEKNSLHAPVFLSTHPLGADRINDLEQLMTDNDWRSDGPKSDLDLPLIPITDDPPEK